MTAGFKLARIPEIHFGPGTLRKLPGLARRCGSSALVVTGARSLQASGMLDEILKDFERVGMTVSLLAVRGEPSPDLVDGAAAAHRPSPPDVVIAVGGGSVVDTGKALSAMIPLREPVFDYLEGVGSGREHPGTKVPFIAVPTTAGTGSEATKNAVLSRTGSGGFKKSMRHDNFVPDAALVDPVLTLTCPPHVTAACGLDAFTQLLESYVSTRAGPLTDALALSGMERAAGGLVAAVREGAENLEARTAMAYASLLSGITLANAGLGTIHGFASEIGGLFDAPHGVICGTLLGAVTRMTITRLRENRSEENLRHLEKYAAAGALLGRRDAAGVDEACDRLLARIEDWIETLEVPRLGRFGVTEADLPVIAAATGNKYNPVDLDGDDLVRILKERL